MKRQNTSPNDGLSASMCRTMSRSFVARNSSPASSIARVAAVPPISTN
ncbi:MAG: hypothetical protein MZU91_12720 [Desulfosudis oleivorans]|nr:hypothetical protein [Desulfosudis oleivorans]